MPQETILGFHDPESELGCLSNWYPSEFTLGRAVTPYDDGLWAGRRQLIVYRGLLAKFRQNPGLAQQLLDTGGAILAKCARTDTVWGIGISIRDPDRLGRSKWQGANLLGCALMEVRDQLSRET